VSWSDVYWSDFVVSGGPTSSFLTPKERFKSPPTAPGPGVYASIDELDLARKAVMWARQSAGFFDSSTRFPSPIIGVGPGEFKDENDIVLAKKAILWSRLAANLEAQAPDERGRLQVRLIGPRRNSSQFTSPPVRSDGS
jgi:hypothetical protein